MLHRVQTFLVKVVNPCSQSWKRALCVYVACSWSCRLSWRQNRRLITACNRRLSDQISPLLFSLSLLSRLVPCTLSFGHMKVFRRGISTSLHQRPTPTFSCLFDPLTPNDHYSGRTAPLTYKRCILYIYSTNIDTEYFKHGI